MLEQRGNLTGLSTSTTVSEGIKQGKGVSRPAGRSGSSGCYHRCIDPQVRHRRWQGEREERQRGYESTCFNEQEKVSAVAFVKSKERGVLLTCRTVTADGVFIYLDGSPSFTLTQNLCSLLDPPHASQHQKLFESDEGPESWRKSSCQVPTTQLDDPRPDETSSSAVTLAQTTPLASRYLSFPVTGLF